MTTSTFSYYSAESVRFRNQLNAAALKIDAKRDLDEARLDLLEERLGALEEYVAECVFKKAK